MKWTGDLGLELYVAGDQYPDAKQQCESQDVLQLIRQHELTERFEFHQLEGLNGHADFFQIIKDPGYDVKLPFLVVGSGCETGAILGYAGLEAITAHLNDLFLK